jgi:hypothetical protein
MSARFAVISAITVAALALPLPAVAQRLDISVTPLSINFPAQDPDAAPVLFSPPVQVTYRVRGNARGAWTLSVLAGGDLISGGATVDISNISWVATPAPPFQNGTLSKTVAQTLASGTGNVATAQTGSVTFRLANLWTYSAGTYTQTIVFTLSAP